MGGCVIEGRVLSSVLSVFAVRAVLTAEILPVLPLSVMLNPNILKYSEYATVIRSIEPRNTWEYRPYQLQNPVTVWAVSYAELMPVLLVSPPRKWERLCLLFNTSKYKVQST